MWFLFGEVFSSSWWLGWAALFYCSIPWAFHIIILNEVKYLQEQLKPVSTPLNECQTDNWSIADTCHSWLEIMDVNDINNTKNCGKKIGTGIDASILLGIYVTTKVK